MRTEQLIQAMAADAVPATRVETLLPLVMALTAALSGFVYLAGMGIRVDFAQAITHLPVILKQVLPWLVVVAGFGAVLRLARPGAELGGWAWALIAVPLIIVAAMLVEAVRLPASQWVPAAKGTSLLTCITSIPLMSVPIAAGSLWVLKRGASTRPGLTGLVAGVMSAGVATGIYSFYCNDDSPLVYGLWYVLAVLIVAAVTALIGSRVLRW